MKFKRLIATALVIVMLIAAAPAAFAQSTADVFTRGEACAKLVAAADDYNAGVTAADIMHGDGNGNLRENEQVSRVEALAMLSRAFGKLPAPAGDAARKAYPASNFTDVPAWAKEELENVFDAGIIAGTSATTLSPDAYITEEQLDTFISRVYALFGTNLKDDFYATVNKTWLDASNIKPGYSLSGTVYDLMYDAEPLTALIKKAIQNPQNEDEKRISALYGNIMDWSSRNAQGIAPIKQYLDAVDAAKTLDELMQVHHTISQELGGYMLIGFGLTSDLSDSSKYILSFSTFSPSMNKELYALDSGAQKQAYLDYMQTLFELGGADKDSAKADAERIWENEKAISPNRLDTQDYGDVDMINNLYTMEQLKALFPNVDLDSVFADSGFAKSDAVAVTDKALLEATAAYFDDSHVEYLKTLLRLSLLAGYGPYLSRDFEDASSAFTQAFLGIEGSASDEDNATTVIQSILGDELGHLYAKEYCSPEAKADVEDMVKDIISVYKTKLQKLTWMSGTTKAKAIEKLDSMGIKVAYPDDGEWNDFFSGVTLLSKDEGGSYFNNIISLNKAQHKKAVAMQTEKADKGIWAMNVYTVNACYVPTNNEIIFPAGILQAPVYDVKASREENLGGIGYIMAHEITHAFDNNGAKFDKNGNAADWWTAEDYAAFQTLCQKVIAYYDGQEVAPGITCNGTLTLSENIADLGAVSCILEAAKMQPNPDLATLFRSAARMWASTSGREMTAYMTQMNVHSPDKLRGMLPLQSLDEFYTTFDIQPGDGMYIAPENRVSIW